VGLRLLGEDITLFRDKNGEVQALWDYCPHRGVYLSWGECFWKGYLSCAYHGATFDGDGECVEFITEGPDSKMVGQLRAKKFPTVTLKGLVFVWMGEGEPVPPEQDIPPELFEDGATVVLNTMRYWNCNWMISLENTTDAHNRFYVHRNSFLQLRSRTAGRPRTPLGSRSTIINGTTAVSETASGERFYLEDGKLPYQMFYPRVGAYWPLHRYRLLWTWLFEIIDRWNQNKQPFETPLEWNGMRLPSMQRLHFSTSGPGVMYTRWCVPVEENLTRVVYLRSARVKTRLGRFYERLAFRLYRNWLGHYNFSDQDYDAMRSVRYQYPEYLSSTDAHVIAERRLVTGHARGMKQSDLLAVETASDKIVSHLYEKIAQESQVRPNDEDVLGKD
jgi:phenylpropionate dioxygenase-like ring-hydroxylating dioxygenase large terminal subunit